MQLLVFSVIFGFAAAQGFRTTPQYPTFDEEGTLESLGDSAVVPISPNGPRARRLANKAFMDDINTRTSSPFLWMPVRILSAQAILVNGAQYELQVVGAESNCPKPKADLVGCQVRFGGRRALFNLVIFEKNLHWTENTPIVFRSFATKIRDIMANERL